MTTPLIPPNKLIWWKQSNKKLNGGELCRNVELCIVIIGQAISGIVKICFLIYKDKWCSMISLVVGWNGIWSKWRSIKWQFGCIYLSTCISGISSLRVSPPFHIMQKSVKITDGNSYSNWLSRNFQVWKCSLCFVWYTNFCFQHLDMREWNSPGKEKAESAWKTLCRKLVFPPAFLLSVSTLSAAASLNLRALFSILSCEM